MQHYTDSILPIGEFVKYEYLGKFGRCPHAGSGVNSWVCKVVDSLLVHGVPADEIRVVVKRLCAGCGRGVDQDISHAIETAHTNLGLGDGVDGGVTYHHIHTRKYDWPAPYEPQIRRILDWGKGLTVDQFTERSPVEVEGITAEAVLLRLFPAWGLVCCGMEKYRAVIATVDVWIRTGVLSDYQFIVPNLMKATRVYGPDGQMLLDRAGRPRVRLLCNTQEGWYVVVELDWGSHNDQAAIIAYLGQRHRLVMIVDSGGKSLHAWFRYDNASEEMFRMACLLGADQSKWHPNGYVRLPQGWRGGKSRRQRVLFLNPK